MIYFSPTKSVNNALNSYTLDNFSSARRFENNYSLKLKSWAISLYLITIGYSLNEHKDLGDIFFILPLIPVMLFWFLHSYNIYVIERYIDIINSKKLHKILSDLYSYSYEELKEISENTIATDITWADKGSFKPRRFFSNKLPGMVKNAFLSIPNLGFYGGMVLAWVIIASLVK